MVQLTEPHSPPGRLATGAVRYLGVCRLFATGDFCVFSGDRAGQETVIFAWVRENVGTTQPGERSMVTRMIEFEQEGVKSGRRLMDASKLMMDVSRSQG